MDDFANKDTVEVTIPVSKRVAELIAADPHNREMVGRVLDERFFPRKETQDLLDALADIHDAVRKSGLTAEEVDEELALWKAERLAGRSDS